MTMQTFTETDRAALRIASTGGKAVTDINRIAGDAAKFAGMSLYRVIGPDRSAPVVRVRDVIAYRAASMGYSATDIAASLHRDASSVRVSIRREKARRGEA